MTGSYGEGKQSGRCFCLRFVNSSIVLQFNILTIPYRTIILAHSGELLYFAHMSRLLKKMNDYVTVNGNGGKADLCKATNSSMRSVEYWLLGQKTPSTQKRYQLAIACGATHEEALELAQERPDRQGKAS